MRSAFMSVQQVMFVQSSQDMKLYAECESGGSA